MTDAEGPFYFAWADAGELPWSATDHVRNDEDVFALEMIHSEGDFPVANITLRNPRVGLLASSRQQWAWISYMGPDDPEPVPLFYGRLVGVPLSLSDDLIAVTFVARPSDYEAQKEALAETLRTLPLYDPVWLSEEDRLDPDRVLEARTAVWHIDRVTHVLTISDIVRGEEPSTPVLNQAQGLYDSLSVSYSSSPARRVHLTAEVGWSQRGEGEINLRDQALQAFADITPSSVLQYNGESISTTGQIVTVGGDNLQEAWPQPERRIGGGWFVGESALELVGQPPFPPTGYPKEVYDLLVASDPSEGRLTARLRGIYQTIRDVLGRSPGYVVQVVHHQPPRSTRTADQIDIVWLPVWRMAPTLTVRWEADRARTETIEFEMLADVQPLLSDPGDEETIVMALNPSYVDEEIGNPLRRSYFKTDRGKLSIEHLLARARAALISRARAIDVTVQTVFDFGVGLSCRQSVAIADDRLPGGIAEGKVKSYTLSVDGDSGEMYASVTLGCSVGRDGDVVPTDGTPSYVADGYVGSGYQVYQGYVTTLPAGDVGYEGIDDVEIDDDGMNLLNVTADSHLVELGAVGGLITQEQRLNLTSTNPSVLYVVDQVSGVRIECWVEMVPVTGGPFLTHYAPTVTPLRVPRTIDLEETT